MKSLFAIAALFAMVTAGSSQTATPGIDPMETHIAGALRQQPVNRGVLDARQERPNEIIRGNVTYSGILVESAKTRNPLQLVNPAAPPEYGSPEDNVVRDPIDGRVS